MLRHGCGRRNVDRDVKEANQGGRGLGLMNLMDLWCFREREIKETKQTERSEREGQAD